MADDPATDLTDEETRALITRVATGDRVAAADLFPLLYRELRALAGSLARDQRGTLQPTALVHEVYVRLAGRDASDWQSHAHFIAVAAKAMRHVLADHARRRGAAKRGGGWRQVTIDDAGADAVSAEPALDVEALDAALTRLAELDERKARVVELRFFGGLTNEAAAQLLGVSRATVADDWTVARAWLRAELSGGAPP